MTSCPLNEDDLGLERHALHAKVREEIAKMEYTSLFQYLEYRRYSARTRGNRVEHRRCSARTPGVRVEARGCFAQTPGVRVERRGCFARTPGVRVERRASRSRHGSRAVERSISSVILRRRGQQPLGRRIACSPPLSRPPPNASNHVAKSALRPQSPPFGSRAFALRR